MTSNFRPEPKGSFPGISFLSKFLSKTCSISPQASYLVPIKFWLLGINNMTVIEKSIARPHSFFSMIQKMMIPITFRHRKIQSGDVTHHVPKLRGRHKKKANLMAYMKISLLNCRGITVGMKLLPKFLDCWLLECFLQEITKQTKDYITTTRWSSCYVLSSKLLVCYFFLFLN